MDSDGSFIVHPMENGLLTPDGQNMSEASIKQAISAMVSGNAGYVPFETDGHRYYLFYKPFERAKVPFRTTTNYKWSIGMAYDEHDIFGAYYRLFNWVVAITLGGIAVMYLLIRLIVLRQLRSLEMLTRHAERIAQGHYNEPIPTTPKIDELGVLQDNFLHMQQSISAHMDKLNELSNDIKQRGRELKAAYKQARQAEKMKTGFLHNTTDQMIQPAIALAENVTALCGNDKESVTATNELVDKIEQDGTTITQLLNNLLDLSEREMDEEKGGEA
jgi:methyl-accepting chemotaxis protein